MLTQELINLERNGNTGKVDHPDGGSKDAADAVCGALWNASKHAEEYAYDFGEDLQTVQNSNVNSNDNDKQQILVDLTEELKNFGLFNHPEGKGLDFGFGKAIPMQGGSFVSDGMLIW